MKSRIATLLIGALMCATASRAEETHSHPPPERLGTVVFGTSCAPAVARDFEHAVALLHSFAYAASLAAFRKVAAADASCAMAHWGAAMSYYHQLWSPPDADALRQGQSEIAQAAKLGARSERERQLIAAAATYFRDADQLAPPVRARAYADAMASAARANPEDLEVQVFYALALISVSPPDDRSHANQKRAAEILEPIYRDHPDHPGVAHYLIHAYDSTELAPRGLAAARAYSKIAPSAPHALHMPSHIFTRLGLWDDSIASNRAARESARAQGDTGEELHAMDYLVYAYLQRGRQADAEQVVKDLNATQGPRGSEFKVGYAVTTMPLRLDMEGHHWESAVSRQPAPESAPEISALVFWARAVASARSGHPQASSADIARLEECQRQLRAAGNIYWATLVSVLGKEAAAWQLAALKQGDKAARQLTLAADAEDGLEKLPATPGPIVPAREQLGDLYLDLKKPRQALRAYQAALLEAPGRRGALTGAALAAELVGDSETAGHMRKALGH